MEKELLSTTEKQALSLTGALANLVSKIVIYGPTHDHDLNELLEKIHQIQHTIMAQAAARAYPDKYRRLGDVIVDDFI